MIGGGEGEGDVRASKLGKDFVEEGDACEDALVVTYCVSMCVFLSIDWGLVTSLFPSKRASPSDSPTTKPP